MSEVQIQKNAIILAAAEKLVSLGSEAAQQLLNGVESKSNTNQGLKIITLFEAYKKNEELTDSETDSLLYCLRNLSEADEFPTTNPIVGKDLNVSITAQGTSIQFFDEGIALGLPNITEIDFVGSGVVVSRSGSRLTVTVDGSGTGSWNFRGDYDGASNDDLPTDSIPILNGFVYRYSTSTVTQLGKDGAPILAGTLALAITDNPGQDLNNWLFFYSIQ